ncbi:MAG: hypothetical protein JST62_14700 [Bacteroidetes bacterium]|nr:hypothetical protein [Bacteroidota bacterium]
MGQKIKMFWDFRGMSALQFAKHHIIHLEEYAVAENLQYRDFSFEEYTDMYAAAVMIVDESEMMKVRDELKPNRAEYADEVK